MFNTRWSLKTPRQLLDGFQARFGTSASIYRAPGRVNLIGEHTDYNDGFVLPAAIEFYCWAAIAPRGDRKLVIHSENFEETIEKDLDSLSPPGKKHWANYPLGVAWALCQAGKPVAGASIYIAGEVPLGAGLSSSAAIEVAVGFALLHDSGQEVERTELAQLCQKAENEFVGARVGIMDQFVSCHGRASHALLLDCRSLEYKYVKLPPDLQLVICNTMVKHEPKRACAFYADSFPKFLRFVPFRFSGWKISAQVSRRECLRGVATSSRKTRG